MAKNRKSLFGAQVKKIHALQWVFEPLEANAQFVQKKMFGCQSGYLNDRLVLVLADSDEPWNGILIPTERANHLSLMSLNEAFQELSPHPVLGKWLYLSQGSRLFEEVAGKVVAMILAGDQRIGVEPKPKGPKKSNEPNKPKKAKK